MKPSCHQCGHTHPSDATSAVGRFNRSGPTGYIARGVPGATIRPTRAEADADACAYRANR